MNKRQRIGELLIADLQADWDKHGKAAIERVADENPAAFARLAVSLLPKEVAVTGGDLDELDDAELNARIAALMVEIDAHEG